MTYLNTNKCLTVDWQIILNYILIYRSLSLSWFIFCPFQKVRRPCFSKVLNPKAKQEWVGSFEGSSALFFRHWYWPLYILGPILQWEILPLVPPVLLCFMVILAQLSLQLMLWYFRYFSLVYFTLFLSFPLLVAHLPRFILHLPPISHIQNDLNAHLRGITREDCIVVSPSIIFTGQQAYDLRCRSVVGHLVPLQQNECN